MALAPAGMGVVVQEFVSVFRIGLPRKQPRQNLSVNRMVRGDRRIDEIGNRREQVVAGSDLLANAASDDRQFLLPFVLRVSLGPGGDEGNTDAAFPLAARTSVR